MGGCAGRMEFRRGLERDLQGDYRGAYRDYHDAYRLSGMEFHREARDRTGSLIASEILQNARQSEAAGKIDAALEEYLHALEYDPDQGELIADFLRLQEHKQDLERTADRADACQGNWEAYRLWRELRRDAVARPDVFLRVRSSALAALDLEIKELLGGKALQWESPLLPALEERLPDRAESLEALLAGLWGISSRLDSLFLDCAGDRGDIELSSPLALRRRVIGSAARIVEDALQAERERKRAAMNEEEGNFEAARAGYERALFLWPNSQKIRDGLARARTALETEASDSALRAMARRDWESALDQLSRLQKLSPGSVEVQRRIYRCRREIREDLLRQGARKRERGLPGNALVAFLRLQALGLGGTALEREIALLEGEILNRLDREVRIECSMKPSPPDSMAKEGDDILKIFEEEVLRVISRKNRPSNSPRVSTGSLPRGSRPVLLVEVVDLEFDYQLFREVAGAIESRFVAEFQDVENPEWIRRQGELEELQANLEKLRGDLEHASRENRAEALVRLEIAEGRLRQKLSDMDQIPRTIPSPIWQIQTHPVHTVKVQARFNLLARMDGLERRLEVQLEAEDREVKGDVVIGIPPERAEIPSRGDALRQLIPRLAKELSAAVEELVVAQRASLLQEARQRLSEDSYEAAVEDLVAFLYAERKVGLTAQFLEGAELFKKITGCTFPLGSQKNPPPQKRQY